MRALLVSPRLPGTGHTGDRVRAALHLDALREAGFSVTLVAGVRGPAPREVPGVERLCPVRLGLPRTAAALPGLFARGAPLQSALFAGPWARALEGIAGDRYGLVVVLLVRAWPFLRGALPPAPLVLDYVDALSLAARVAGDRERGAALRAYWRLEAPRLARLEREAGEGAALRLATTPFDAAALPAGTRALPNGVALGPAPGPAGARGRVVVFSGRLGYRPNVVAVTRLLSRIWPKVKGEVPDAALAIGGADAPAWLRRRSGHDGITVTTPVTDMGAFLRRARVAALPLELGTGSPNKLFEAFEAGVPAVAPAALFERALDVPCSGAIPAQDDAEFAAHLVALLDEDETASGAGAAARAWVAKHAAREQVVARLASWFREAAGLAGVTT